MMENAGSSKEKDTSPQGQLAALNTEYDSLEQQQKEKGNALRELRERAKNGEQLDNEINATVEEIQDMTAMLDGLYRRIKRMESNIKTVEMEKPQQQKEVSQAQEKNSEDNSQEQLKITLAQKEFADEIKRTLNFVYERNNQRLTTLFSDEAFSMLDQTKRLLSQDMFSYEDSKKAFELLKQAFEMPVRSNQDGIRENTDSLGDFIQRCNKLKDMLGQYQYTIKSLGDTEEAHDLITRISRAADMIEAKKIKIQIARSYL